MTATRVEIYNGFKAVQRIDKLNSYSAYNIILGTSKQLGYSEALSDFKDDAVYFKKDLLICPVCGYQMGAYKHTVKGGKPQKIISRSRAYEWCCVPSIFDEAYKTLMLYAPFTPTDKIICPNCSHSAPIATTSVGFDFKYNRHKLTVSTELTSVRDIIGIRWAESLALTDFPLTESITFNFRKGHIFSTLSANGKIVCCRDITSVSCDNTSKLIFAIDSNSFIKGALKRYFRKEWGKALPYKNNELNFRRFCEMTTYIGYTKEFYSNIPYVFNKNNALAFNTLFVKARKRLHRYEYTPTVFSASSLPGSKALKRLMFDNPSYFFYIRELEKLNIIFGDLNILLTFMKNDEAYSLLSFMHTYENIFNFYADFKEVKGKGALLRYLVNHSEDFNKYGTVYLSLSEKLRKKAQNEWKARKESCIGEIVASLKNYRCSVKSDGSLPSSKNFEFKKMNTDGYTFSILKSKNDYVYYGEELDNCLGEIAVCNPVICMSKNGHAVAAIEVDTHGKSVEQALLKNNEPIEANKTVFAAFNKWRKANKLEY